MGLSEDSPSDTESSEGDILSGEGSMDVSLSVPTARDSKSGEQLLSGIFHKKEDELVHDNVFDSSSLSSELSTSRSSELEAHHHKRSAEVLENNNEKDNDSPTPVSSLTISPVLGVALDAEDVTSPNSSKKSEVFLSEGEQGLRARSRNVPPPLDEAGEKKVEVVEKKIRERLGPKWYKDFNFYRLFIMASMLFVFFWMELFGGIATNSLALVSDAFHMASDFISLIVGFAALQYAKRGRTGEYTYGLVRAEVLGGFMNGCFLLAIGFFIMVEAVQRYVDIPKVENPLLLTVVAIIGLGVNIAGIFIFHNHSGHSHGHDHGHADGHSHHDHGHEEEEHVSASAKDVDDVDVEVGLVSPKSPDPEDAKDAAKLGQVSAISIASRLKSGEVVEDEEEEEEGERSGRSGRGDADDVDKIEDSHVPALLTAPVLKKPSLFSRVVLRKKDPTKPKKHKNMALQGVFLHIIGDALASVGVIISGLCILFMPWEWKYYIDPTVSICISLIIFKSAFPLVRRCSKIFLQRVPKTISIPRIRAQISEIPGVLGVHDLHIWQLIDQKTVATAHVAVDTCDNSLRVLEACRKLLVDVGIHSTTIQIEALDQQHAKNVMLSLDSEDNIDFDDVDPASCIFPCSHTDMVCCREIQPTKKSDKCAC